MFAPWRWAPKMCTGKPSADASRWLSPVMMQQEKSRADEITAERAARSSVLVISRTMPSSRLAITVISTGSSCAAGLLVARTGLRDVVLVRGPGILILLRLDAAIRIHSCATHPCHPGQAQRARAGTHAD